MDRGINRRGVLGLGVAAALAIGAGRAAAASSPADIGYLEALVLAEGTPYLAPSRLPLAYGHAVYVNTALSGNGAQKMWVLERTAAGWQLAVHDPDHWAGKGQPAYSWPVSTGRTYPGDKRSGPTPTGIFNVDERRARHRPGWGSEGMYNAVYIDLHYSGGRVSGVAIHGTTAGKYRNLGRADSHGCVRMRQDNADRVWALIHPGGARAEASPIWGEVPRFFASAPRADMSARTGYVRDGTLLTGADGAVLTRPGYRMVFVFFRDDL